MYRNIRRAQHPLHPISAAHMGRRGGLFCIGLLLRPPEVKGTSGLLARLFFDAACIHVELADGD